MSFKMVEVVIKRELVYKVKYFSPSVEDSVESAKKLEQLPDPVSEKREILFAGEIPTSELRRKHEDSR